MARESRVHERTRDKVQGFDDGSFGALTRKLQLSLIDGNLERAHRLVDLFAGELREERKAKKAVLEPGDSVAQLVDPETACHLENGGFLNIASVIAATDAELLRVYMFGAKRLKMLREALAKHGFSKKSSATVVLTPI